MQEHQVRRIPVIDEKGWLVGIISQADVATRIDEPEKTHETVEEISKAASP
jgi:CBS-domain-containing membrane protein